MEAITKHRSHSAAFKREVTKEVIAGKTLHRLSQRHDISRQLIRIWVGKFEAGARDEDEKAADLLQEYEAKIAAAWQFLSGLHLAQEPRNGNRLVLPVPAPPHRTEKGVVTDLNTASRCLADST